MKRWDLGNVAGYTKHVIGMCADEEPHTKIASALWRLLKGLRSTGAFKNYQRAVAIRTALRRRKP